MQRPRRPRRPPWRQLEVAGLDACIARGPKRGPCFLRELPLEATAARQPIDPKWLNRLVVASSSSSSSLLLMLLLLLLLLFVAVAVGAKRPPQFYISQLPIDRLCGCYWYINVLICQYIDMLICWYINVWTCQYFDINIFVYHILIY